MTEEEFKNSFIRWTKKGVELVSKNKSYLLMYYKEYDWITSYVKYLCEYTQAKSVVEAGFGLGFTADQFQQQHLNNHIIFEPHPDLYYLASKWAKGKSNVVVINDFIQNAKDIKVDLFYDDRYDLVYGQDLELQKLNIKCKYYISHIMETNAKAATEGIEFLYNNEIHRLPLRKTT